MNDLQSLLKYESTEINQLFEKASLEGKGTSQEISDRREVALTNFLKKYFPFPYRIAKGNIIDSYNLRSASIDCIILNPIHPYTTADDSKYSIILADGVDIAIELKPDLNSDKEIIRSLEQIMSVKKLTRRKGGVLQLVNIMPKQGQGKYNVTDEYLFTSLKIPGVIFSIKTYVKVEMLLDKICSYYEKSSIKRDLQFDIIAVNKRFIIVNSRKDSYIYLNKLGEGFFIFNYGEDTLTAFLMHLNSLPQSEVRISNSILSHYLKITTTNIETISSVNDRLSRIETTTNNI